MTYAVGSKPLAADFTLWNSPPRIAATASSTAGIATGTWSLVAFDGEGFKSGITHSTSVDNSRITIATAGLYVVHAVSVWAANATGDRYLEVFKNAAGTWGGGSCVFGGNAHAAASFESFTQAVAYISLAAGDYLEMFRYQSSGGSLAPASAASVPAASMTLQLVAAA